MKGSSNLKTPGCCWCKNDRVTYGNIYGALNNGYTVNTKKLCPTDWHVPSDAEWSILITFLGGEALARGKMKEAGTTHWKESNTGVTNESGFSGLPGGFRDYDGYFLTIGNYCDWWSSTESSTTRAWARTLGYDSSALGRGEGSKTDGFGVRCVRDL